MDRRSFIVDAAALIAGTWGGYSGNARTSVPEAVAARADAPVMPVVPELPRTIVLVDISLGRSIAFASDAVSAGASLVQLGNDVGALWYTRLAGTRGRLAGVLRPSDAFVLSRLARHAGHTVTECPLQAGTVELAVVLS